MERFPNDNAPIQENVEDLSAWRALRDEAPHKAEELIAQIEGYSDMDLDAKVEALTAKEEELLKEDNKNRYIAKEVARQREILKAEIAYANQLRSLRIAA